MSELSPMTPTPAPPARRLILVLGALVLGALLSAITVLLLMRDDHASGGAGGLHEKPSNTLLLATRDLSRLETSELHVEKVIDLTDTQSSLYGLVEGTDNVLLVAVGDVSVGVDLAKLKDGDVSMDEHTHAAHMKLPQPEVFSARLDEKGTYVYSRSTSLFARRNEQLESRARQAAQDAIQRQADTEDTRDRARRQAEKVLRELATSLGATSVTFEWR